MRMAFGLIGILGTLGVIVYFMGAKGGLLEHDKAVIDAGNKATAQVNQIGGRDSATGAPAKESAVLEAQQSNGYVDSILVTGITDGGAYAKMWGLQRNDSIVGIGPLTMKDVASDGNADDFVLDAYQRHMSLTVMRDGQKMELQPADMPMMQGIPTH